MLNLNNFVFSSQNLQDFQDCERRFELKYLLKQEWPAPQSEPAFEVERRIRIGREFHFMIHQYLCGIPLDDLLRMDIEPEIHQWLKLFKTFIENYSFVEYQSEFSIIMPFHNYFLTAVYDLIGLTDQSKLLIMDWKTSPHPPKKESFTRTVQNILYPFMAYENRRQIFKVTNDIGYGDMEMIYWNAIHPQQVVIFPYSAQQHKKNNEFLADLTETISQKSISSFSKTDDKNKCAYCQYRSLCQRGIQAGMVDQNQENPFEIDEIVSEMRFDDSAEIPY